MNIQTINQLQQQLLQALTHQQKRRVEDTWCLLFPISLASSQQLGSSRNAQSTWLMTMHQSQTCSVASWGELNQKEETNKDTYYLLPHSLSFGELKLLWLKQRSTMTYMKNVKGNRHPITSKGNKNEYQTWSPIIQPVSEVLHFCRLSLLLASNQITTCAALSHRSWWTIKREQPLWHPISSDQVHVPPLGF